VTLSGNSIRLSFGATQSAVGNEFELTGMTGASCSFYGVRSSAITLNEQPSLVTLLVPDINSEGSFAVRSHGSISGTLTSQEFSKDLPSGFICTRMVIRGIQEDKIEGEFSSAGDSIYFYTDPDARLDFRSIQPSNLQDTQIRVINELRFSHVEPGRSPEEKTVLLDPPPGRKNEVSFERLDKVVGLSEADLLEIVPRSDFYVRHFAAKNGIQLSLHGDVRDVRLGAGSSDLQTVMPSLFDHLSEQKRFYGVIPGIVALILGILEKMKVLPK